VTEPQPEKSRKGVYRISDPFVGSWFRFVHPNRDLLERGLVDDAMQTAVRHAFSTSLPLMVEPIVRDLFLRSPLSRRIPFEVARAGRYWSPTAEFDLVMLDVRRKHAFVAELKWTRKPVSLSLLDDLRSRVANEAAFRDFRVQYGLITRDGVSGKRNLASDETVVDLSAVKLTS
jgi:AAA+ ATPase superfamily predicted ATPase